MSEWFKIYAICAVVALFIYTAVRLRRLQQNKPLPPGPKGYPLIGNLFDIPKSHDPRVWAKFKDEYGPITSLSSLGRCIVVINDLEVAKDLLNKISPIYSDRPSFIFAGDLTASPPYSNTRTRDSIKCARKYLSQVFGTKALANRFSAIFESEAQSFLLRVCERPKDLFRHARTWAGAVALRVSYGYSIDQDGDSTEFLISGIDGRRICPGIELADASLFMVIAISTAVLDIRKREKILDSAGSASTEIPSPNPASADWTGEFVSHPIPFDCEIRPRSRSLVGDFGEST